MVQAVQLTLRLLLMAIVLSEAFVDISEHALAADFNGDGKSDILWRDTSGNVAIWFMNGAQAQYAGLGNVPTDYMVVTGDFNGDGKSDILAELLRSGGDLVHGRRASAVCNTGRTGRNGS